MIALDKTEKGFIIFDGYKMWEEKTEIVRKLIKKNPKAFENLILAKNGRIVFLGDNINCYNSSIVQSNRRMNMIY